MNTVDYVDRLWQGAQISDLKFWSRKRCHGSLIFLILCLCLIFVNFLDLDFVILDIDYFVQRSETHVMRNQAEEQAIEFPNLIGII